MRAIVLAYHDIGCVGIEALNRHGVEIAAVFTHRDDPGENRWFRSVAEEAAARDLPVFAPADINHPHWIEHIRELAPDILFSFYYRDLVGERILEIPPRGCLNLHGSLLPRYRGRAPINWVLVNGETETGVTLHHMTLRPDAGDIVGQRAIPISPDDTGRTLHEKAAKEAGLLLDDLLPRIVDGTAPRVPQDPAQATYFGGRRPSDGEIDWSRSAREIRNLIRAVTLPYPGAFSHLAGRKLFIWQGAEESSTSDAAPGTVVSTDPLVIACGDGALRVLAGQIEDGVYLAGRRLAGDLQLVPGMRLEPPPPPASSKRKTRVLILGVNGFIGNHLSERLLASGTHEVYGMDLGSGSLQRLRNDPDFHFREGDISIHREWIEYHVRKCDVVVPLVAIATPIEYVRNPLRVFELDFEENLRIVRYCAKYGKRIIFPSTSEVYGMSEDRVFDEDRTNLVLGPIRKQRWIYACSKQLLDRVIWAYGDKHGLPFTLFRPFNWIGPRLDTLDAARIGSSRAITQLILNLTEGTPIQLVDGGSQRRCFTDVEDGIEALYRVIENRDGLCDGKIVNIGNPNNEASIRGLAETLVERFERHPLRERFPPFAGYRVVESREYYGRGYEDLQFRAPSIRNARKFLGWEPKIGLEEAVGRTLDFFLAEAAKGLEESA